MSVRFNSGYAFIALVPLAIAAVSIAWQQSDISDRKNVGRVVQDTVAPGHKPYKEDRDSRRDDKDLDKAMNKLDKALEKAAQNLENINWKEVEEEIKSSTEEATNQLEQHQIDVGHLRQKLDEVMKNIDLDKIRKGTDRAMKRAAESINYEDLNKEIQRSLDEAKSELDREDIQRFLHEAGKVNMEKMRGELENLADELKKAKNELLKEPKTIEPYCDMMALMERDGLITDSNNFSIDYHDNELYVDGKKQSRDILDKYKPYFKGGKIKLIKTNGRFTIDTD